MVWNCLASLNFKATKFSCDWLKEKLKRKPPMYCNEKKKLIGTLPSYALYCSDSDNAFI